MKPYRNSGTFSATRKTDRVIQGGVVCASSMEVPEMPLSYRPTGDRNMVTPKALMQPDSSSVRKFFPLRDSFSGVFKALIPFFPFFIV